MSYCLVLLHCGVCISSSATSASKGETKYVNEQALEEC